LSSISEADVLEIKRLASKKSIKKIAKELRKDLDRETLALIISAYLVLKANGHPDGDLMKYLTRKETRKTLKLGFEAGKAVLPALLTDGEFRSLVMNTRKQMKKQKQIKEEKQREPQQRVSSEPDNEAKIGPVKVKLDNPPLTS
jgi:hypothetical protein